MKYELEERVEKYGEEIIGFVKHVRETITRSIIDQLVRSSTSIGANYFEANGASSKKDFINKIYLCKKESNETQHWLRMLAKANESDKTNMKKYWLEARELSMIFATIIKNTKAKK